MAQPQRPTGADGPVVESVRPAVDGDLTFGQWPPAQYALVALCLLLGGWAPSLVTGGRTLPLLWALLGVVLLVGGLRLRAPGVRWAGLLLLGLAGGSVLLQEIFPLAFGLASVSWHLRALAFAMPIGAVGLGVWAYTRLHGDGQVRMALAIGAHLLLIGYLTLAIALAYAAGGDGTIAGNGAMALAAGWGLYGVVLAVVDLRLNSQALRNGARFVLAASLSYLLLGAMMGNARWAYPLYRYIGYVAALGGIWLVELLFRRHREDAELNGTLPLTAALCGLLVVGFEVTRLLEPAFTLSSGEWATAEFLRWQGSVATFWQVSAQSLYAVTVMLAGVWLGARRVRLLAAGLFGLILLQLLLPLPSLDAPLALRLLAFAALAGGAVVAGALGKWATWRTGDDGRPVRVERMAHRLLCRGGALVGLLWVVWEISLR